MPLWLSGIATPWYIVYPNRRRSGVQFPPVADFNKYVIILFYLLIITYLLLNTLYSRIIKNYYILFKC